MPSPEFFIALTSICIVCILLICIWFAQKAQTFLSCQTTQYYFDLKRFYYTRKETTNDQISNEIEQTRQEI